MSQVSAAYVQAFSNQLKKLNGMAGKTVVNEAARLELEQRLLSGDDIAYEDMQAMLHRVCGTYSRLASAMTCHYYDGIRRGANVPGEFNAQQYDGYDKEEINRAAWKIYDNMKNGRNSAPLGQLLGNLPGRAIKNANERTMRENVRRDPAKPKYAIVPNGKACAFCQMRASLGYQYASQASVKSHHHCTCVPTQVYRNQKVQGYDPKKYKQRYDDALEAYESGEIPDELKKRIDAGNYDKTSATLMVMRYQQGIS